MTNLLGTSTTPFEDIFIDEDKAQQEGDEEPPHEGEGSGIPHTGGSVDEVLAGDELFEDPILV